MRRAIFKAFFGGDALYLLLWIRRIGVHDVSVCSALRQGHYLKQLTCMAGIPESRAVETLAPDLALAMAPRIGA